MILHGVLDSGLLRRMCKANVEFQERMLIFVTALLASMDLDTNCTHEELWHGIGRRIAACGNRHKHLVIGEGGIVDWPASSPWKVDNKRPGHCGDGAPLSQRYAGLGLIFRSLWQ